MAETNYLASSDDEDKNVGVDVDDEEGYDFLEGGKEDKALFDGRGALENSMARKKAAAEALAELTGAVPSTKTKPSKVAKAGDVEEARKLPLEAGATSTSITAEGGAAGTRSSIGGTAAAAVAGTSAQQPRGANESSVVKTSFTSPMRKLVGSTSMECPTSPALSRSYRKIVGSRGVLKPSSQNKRLRSPSKCVASPLAQAKGLLMRESAPKGSSVVKTFSDAVLASPARKLVRSSPMECPTSPALSRSYRKIVGSGGVLKWSSHNKRLRSPSKCVASPYSKSRGKQCGSAQAKGPLMQKSAPNGSSVVKTSLDAANLPSIRRLHNKTSTLLEERKKLKPPPNCCCKSNVCKNNRYLYHQSQIPLSYLVFRPNTLEADIAKKSLKVERVDYVAPWHFECNLLPYMRTQRGKNRGRVPNGFVYSACVPLEHFSSQTVDGVETFYVCPLVTDDHMKRTAEQCLHYCRFVKKNAFGQLYTDDVGKVLCGTLKRGAPSPIGQENHYYLYTTDIQRELRECKDITQINALLANAYAIPNVSSPIEPGTSWAEMASLHESISQTQKGKPNAEVGEFLCRSFFDRTSTREKIEFGVESQSKKHMKLSHRMSNIIYGVFASDQEGAKLKVNSSVPEKIFNSLFPFTTMAKYNSTRNNPNLPPPPSELFWKNRSQKSSDFEQLQHEKSGVIVYRDVGNITGLGSNMLLLRAGDCIKPYQLDQLNKLVRYSGVKALPLFIQMLCCNHVDFCAAQNKLSDSQISEDTEALSTYQISMDKVIALVEGIFNGIVDFCSFIPQSPMDRTVDNTPQLTRIQWIHWNLVTPHFRSNVPPYRRKMIDENIDLLTTWVRELNPNASEEEFARLLEEALVDARKFHYAVIIAITQQSYDEIAMEVYTTIMKGVPNAWFFFKQISAVGGFNKFYSCLIEMLRKSSLQVTKAQTLIFLALKYVIDGPVHGKELRAMYQFAAKKQNIADNSEITFTGKLELMKEVGVDTHVARGIGLVLSHTLNLPINSPLVQKCIFVIARNLPPHIMIITNEMMGMVGQILHRGMNKPLQAKLLNFVFDKIRNNDAELGAVLDSWSTNSSRGKGLQNLSTQNPSQNQSDGMRLRKSSQKKYV